MVLVRIAYKLKLRKEHVRIMLALFDFIWKGAQLQWKPVIPALLVEVIWYYGFYNRHWFFGRDMEVIHTAAWIPGFIVLYSVLFGFVINTVWGEFKMMKLAVKNYDLEKFMELRDESVPGLIHYLLFMLSSLILFQFMVLDYPSVMSGLCDVGTTAYVFGLCFFVIVEMDNPLAGIWIIKGVHHEWLVIDVTQWRKNKCQEQREKYKALYELDIAARAA